MTTALVDLPGSKALNERLATEERKLADLEAQLRVATAATRPSVLPHPTLIARYITGLAAAIESGDVAKAGAVLRQALAPFRMLPEGTSYKMAGALDVSVCSERVAGA